MNKTLQQEQFEVKHANELEIAKRELMRRSHDTIRVYNPLDHTFSFMYDRFWHRVPAKSYKDMERYLALKFFKNICDKMIGDQIQKKGQELIELRIKQFGSAYLDKYDENVEVWDRTPRMNDPELIAKIRERVIIGLVEEFGEDEPEMMEAPPDAQTDYRPLHEQMFDSLKPISADTPLPVDEDKLKGFDAPIADVKEKKVEIQKEDLEKEVLSES